MFLLLFLQVQYSGGSCSDTNTGYFIGFSVVFFFVCAISVAQLVIIISVQNNKKSKVMKILPVILPQQRKQPTFCDATGGFPMKICLRNGCRNSVLMSLHHSDLGRASDWLKQIYHAAPLIRSTTQIWVVTCAISMEFLLACFSDVILRGNQCWRHKWWLFYLGYSRTCCIMIMINSIVLYSDNVSSSYG